MGASDCRAGPSNAPNDAPIAASAYNTQGWLNPRKVSSASTPAVIAMPACVMNITRRRSDASASVPPAMEKKMIGISRTSPTMPSAIGRRCGGTSSDTCHSSAAVCMFDPENEMSCPVQSRRKFRC